MRKYMIQEDGEKKMIWSKIKEFEFDDIDCSLSFSERLARENGWNIEYALRAIEEYKKFMYLIWISNQALTPSDQVDEIWHLHLIYTQSYWQYFCTPFGGASRSVGEPEASHLFNGSNLN